MSKNVKTNNALLFFENGTKINVHAQGKNGIFPGFLTFVEGTFSVKELQLYANKFQFFATNNNVVETDSVDSEKHIVVMANNFDINTKNKIDNLTLVSNFTPESISFLQNHDKYFDKFNNVKCVLFFPDDINTINENDTNKISEILNNMPNKIYNFDYTKMYTKLKPYKTNDLRCEKFNNFKKMPIFYNRRKVALIDFSTQSGLLTILRQYFSISVLPFTETYRHIKYLYNDKKIDAVIIPDFICNTYFFNQAVTNEIQKLIESEIPLLGIGNGAILIAETLSSTTQIVQQIYSIDNFFITNNHKKQFIASNFNYKNITSLSSNLTGEYYDIKANIVGFRQRKTNTLGYTFSFFSNNLDTAFFFNEFYKIIKDANKKRR